MYESQAEQDALDNRAQARQEAHARADDYHAGSWVAGVLKAARRAPYHHNYGESDSFYITVQTSQGPRQLWGKDLERAISESKSHVRVGDKIGVRITRQEEVTVATADGKKESRTRNHFEVEKATYIVARQRAARHIVEESLNARHALKEGKVVAASILVANAAETLADAYRLNPHHREAFVEGVKAAAGLPARVRELPADGPEPAPTTRADFERRRAEEFQRGAWIEGRLRHVEKAPYRHDPRNSESTLIELETSYGTQPIWGVDLDRAVSRSKSHVKVGDLVAVRITQTDRNPNSSPNQPGPTRSFHRYEIETQRYIARSEQLAREILDDPARARREGRSGKMTEAAYLLMRAANTLADVQMMDANERKGFIEAVKAAAAVPRPPPEKLPGKTVEPPRTVTSPPRRQESSPREAFARE
jgi:hypothetical protein